MRRNQILDAVGKSRNKLTQVRGVAEKPGNRQICWRKPATQIWSLLASLGRIRIFVERQQAFELVWDLQKPLSSFFFFV